MMDLSPAAHREFCDDPFAKRYRVVIFWSIFVACCLSRLLFLEAKSMMHDETLFAQYTFAHLYQQFNYKYEPILHGPTMLHLQNLIFHIFGASDYTVRLGCALLGIGGLFWIWKLRYWLGEAGTWFGMLFYTLSPGITFYQRFFRNDALYMFTSLWIVASFANWWRTRDGRWAASGIIGVTVLFTNKESSLFLYFSIVTFVLLFLIHDFTRWFFEGKAEDLQEHLQPAPRFPNPFWPTLLLGGFVVLCLTQVFEGLSYSDAGTRNELGHDWVLKDVYSIPLALNWMSLHPTQSPDAGVFRENSVWRLFYAGLFGGLFAAFSLLKVLSDLRIGNREGATRLWRLFFEARYYIFGALGVSVAVYLLSFTTFLKFETGFFQIYRDTWDYWGGQHEWGRIPGPFHMHTLNMVVYELPALFIVLGCWIVGLFQVKSCRSLGIAMLLMLVPAAAFHKLLFSGIQYLPPGGSAGISLLNIDFLKQMVMFGVLVALPIFFFPRSAKALIPLAFIGLVVWFWINLTSNQWNSSWTMPIYKDGMPVFLKNNHVNLRDYMEIKFNFDGGWNLLLVLMLVFFAVYYTWTAISEHRRFEAFLIWWTVTATGAASYAREGVSQVGIHAMLPLILLSGVYIHRLYIKYPSLLRSNIFYGVLGVMVLWNMKANINLNFHNANDPRERMVYGPNADETRDQLLMIREYNKIAGIRKTDNGTPMYISDYNNEKEFKNTRIYMRPLTGITWPARWYLRDIKWEEGSNPERAIRERWEFLMLEPGDVEKYPELKEHYNIHPSRGTIFWTPDLISISSLVSVWKTLIPEHRLDGETKRLAETSKKDWERVTRYFLLRETFDGSNRPYPSISVVYEYVFCYRKDLY